MAGDQLADLIGAKPPAELDRLTKSELASFTAIVAAAVEHHEQAIDDAEENIVSRVPRPARGTVRRILKSGR